MLFCRSGGRSGEAASLLKEMGFKQVYDLNGGYNAWLEAGY
jgi:rhodanese-related sulfurtransferase